MQIVSTTKGENATKKTFQQFGGIIADLSFDPRRWAWSGNRSLLHTYSAKKGCTHLLEPRTRLEKPIAPKWNGVLPDLFQPKWKEVWIPCRPKKEARFLWSVYHYAIVINAWRSQMNDQIDVNYTLCTLATHETVLHRTALCPKAQLWWRYALTILYTYYNTPLTNNA